MSAIDLGSRAIIGSFYERLNAATGAGWLGAVAMDMDSNQESETYKWLGQVPQLREWVGGRDAKGFTSNGLTIQNKVWEATLTVLIDEIRRDKTGQVMVRVNELAERAASHPASLISTLILNGAGATSGLAYDGQYFFDTDHSEGSSGSQSNSITFDISDGGLGGTYLQPTAASMQRAILNAVSAMLAFKDDQGEPMNENASQFLVMVPPVYMTPAMAACNLVSLDAGASGLIANQSMFSIKPVINARLSSWTDKFVVFNADGSTKAFINQIEQPVQIDAQAEGSPEEFNNRRHLYGLSRIGNVAYGMWQKACLVTMVA
jgi:phage major head subunit gpT-like protein